MARYGRRQVHQPVFVRNPRPAPTVDPRPWILFQGQNMLRNVNRNAVETRNRFARHGRVVKVHQARGVPGGSAALPAILPQQIVPKHRPRQQAHIFSVRPRVMFVVPPTEHETGLWLFNTPKRITIDLEGQFAWSLWTRVHRVLPITLIRHQSTGQWEEFSASPFINEPSFKYLYGAHGFNNIDGFVVDYADRKYIGGHDYIVNDALYNELVSAVTPQEPLGYGAYMTPTTRTYTGDEVISGGFVAGLLGGH